MRLGLPCLAEVFDRAERIDRRIEKGQEIGDEDIIEKQVLIAMPRLPAEVIDTALEQGDVLAVASLDLMGPHGQLTLRGCTRVGRCGW
jgi:hypothetical protein